MRRLLLVFLGCLALSRPGAAKDSPATQMANLIGACYQGAYAYGNYQACLRMQPVAAWAYGVAGLNPIDLQVHKLLFLMATGNYSQVIAPAQALLQSGKLGDSVENNLLLRYCLVSCGLRAGYPELVNRYLPEAVQWGERSKNPEIKFSLACLEAQIELEKQPDMPTEAVLAKHDQCWHYLDGFVPTGLNVGGAEVSRNIRFWEDELLRRQQTVAFQRDRDRLWLLAAEGISASGGYNPQYRLGWCDARLEYVKFFREHGSLPPCREVLSELEQKMPAELVGVANWQKQIDALVQGLLATLDRALPDHPDLSALHFSFFEGNISRVQARLHQEWIRLLLAEHPSGTIDKAVREELHRRLDLARQAQAVAARGVGFLGMEEVRWDALAVLFRLREPGWEEEAGRLIQDSLELSRRLGFRLGEIAALSYQGDLQKARGKSQDSLHSYQQAVTLVEKFVTETAGGGAAAERTRGRYKHIYDAVTEVQLELGKPEEAFATQGRLQQMSQVAQPLPQSPALARAVALRGQTRSLEQEISAAKGSGQSTDTLEKQLQSTRSDFYAELSRIRTSNPKYESRLAIRPVNFGPLQKKIPADTCLIQYFPADSALYIFVATSTDLKIHKVKVADSELQDLVRQFRAAVALQKAEPARDSLLKLHRFLIDPVEADLGNKQVLAFIPTGVLDYLPFGCLARPAPGGSGVEYLIQRKQVAIILKSSDLDALSGPPNRPSGGVLALGNPDGSLPGAGQEATEVSQMFSGSQLFLGQDATPEHLKAGAAYIHLATHGILNAEDPNASYLLLAGAQPRLSVQRIFDLHLDGVRLVTLSACQTAVGQEKGTEGSELSTLAGAFSVAGSNSVVASLWSVDDDSTLALMTEFYGALKKGASLAGALRQAQLKLLAQPSTPTPSFGPPLN